MGPQARLSRDHHPGCRVLEGASPATPVLPPAREDCCMRGSSSSRQAPWPGSGPWRPFRSVPLPAPRTMGGGRWAMVVSRSIGLQSASTCSLL
jgi:hypothetical protein